jgi:hypothetical protein
VSRATAVETLSADHLNRATLARQLLLEPSTLDVAAAVHAIAGLQAQEPASPYIGLWTRLAAFDTGDLDAALAARTVVKGTLMRVTLHLVTTDDYRWFWPAVRPMHQAIRRQDRADPPDPSELERWTSKGAAFTNEPRSLSELRDHLADIVTDRPVDEAVWWVRRQASHLHAPSPGVPWSFGRRPRLVDARSWLGEPDPFPPEDAALDHLARRYLAAFGPATPADLGQWSGLAVARIRPALDRLEAADELRRFRDERGRALVDLAGAPRPPADTPAPPRLLPMWDSTLLAFADRTRVISDADRAVVIAPNGDTLPTFTVDGRVAGLWWAERHEGGDPHVVLEPFRPIPAAARRALERDAVRLAAFVAPHEPTVYSRYQRWRPAR